MSRAGPPRGLDDWLSAGPGASAYLSVRLGFPKREVYCATKAYSLMTDELRNRVSARVFDLIVHTDNRAKMTGLEAWVRAS